MTDCVLVTGGAGYIGSHACKQLRAAGYLPVSFDNLSTGWRDAVKFGPLVQGDLLDAQALRDAFAEYQPVAVMHFAALSQVGEAMGDPGRYWRENVTGALNLIEVALTAGCKRVVFSSTCATYGDQDGVLLDEATRQQPLNAYGGSKLAIERMLTDFGASHGLESVIFRYFNVAGADPDGEIGEYHRPETHLIPLVLDAASGRRAALTVYGTDYPTRDGTCLRDYVHVMDLVDAHILGLRWLLGGKGNAVFCLGSGSGFTVREVMAKAAEVTGLTIPVEEGPRRGGDAVSLISGSQLAIDQLGWRPERSRLDQMVADAWRWHQTGGYRG
ncbi:UDP-glucose 4-epimerase GalE [Paracoccus sp. M683]|uniref:UDP-glucose 4-epimerase GalE n=1 Tax=Paracoccus sp. M683 TaxID=2594268 RepID=UPI00117CA43D|nr:UDP-glucose 4-epimerase GalE [Paracoccus sp. M683]TRW98650.1 UDP-glucose 4-epimerase GalE [Paracoccus sp. M683]